MNINEFNKELFNYIKENNLEKIPNFPIIALYQFLEKSGLNSQHELILQTSDTGSFDLVDRQKVAGYQYQYSADSKGIHLEDVNPGYSEHRHLISHKEKYFNLAMYDLIQKSSNIKDIIDGMYDLFNLGEYNYSDLLLNNDYLLKSLESFITSYDSYISTDEPEYISSVLTDLFRLLNTVDSGVKDYHPFRHMIYEYIVYGIPFTETIPTLLMESNLFISVTVGLNLKRQDIFNNFDIENTLMSTLLKNTDRKQIVDEIFEGHVLPAFKERLELQSKLLAHSKTFEQRLSDPHVAQFMSSLMVKYPNSFRENEQYGFKSGEYKSSDLQHNRNLSQLVNKFKLLDDISKHYIDFNYSNRREFFVVNHEEDKVVRLIGETDNAVKYIITGIVKEFDSGIKGYEVQGINMLREDSFYNKLGFEQLFKYCEDNQLALLFRTTSLQNKLEKTFDDFMEVQKNYENTVFLVPNGTDHAKIRLLNHTSLDYSNFMKHQQALVDKCSNSFVDSETLHEFEQSLKTKKKQPKI